MDRLLDHLEEVKKQYLASNPMSEHLFTAINLAWMKLNKYYALTDNNAVLYAAIALHPGMKFDYFEANWSEHPLWITNAKDKVRALWTSRYLYYFNYYIQYLLITSNLDIKILHRQKNLLLHLR